MSTGSTSADDGKPGYRIIEIEGEQVLCCRGFADTSFRQELESALLDTVDTQLVMSFAGQYPVYWLAQHADSLGDFLQETGKGPMALAVQAQTETVNRKFGERRATGMFDMHDLKRLLPRGTRVTIDQGGDRIGGEVVSIALRKNSMDQVLISVTMTVVHAMAKAAMMGEATYNLPGFQGLLAEASLPVRPLTGDVEAALERRGRVFAAACRPGTVMQCSGQVAQPKWVGIDFFPANGRFVVDPVSLSQLEPDLNRMIAYTSSIDTDDFSTLDQDAEVSERDYWRCQPYLYGFSLASKRWGRVRVADLAEAVWQPAAFDQLVMPEADKKFVRALVEFGPMCQFTDIISGKGGGTIILLHGESGEGKTTTAEAVAELLRRPLYPISVGELGTSPERLETRLRKVLEAIQVWNAVGLIDEADIFLEQRDNHDVLRNAMVGIFLRLLEYHNGVLFLTTNRVKRLDKAFRSRITFALRFRSAAEEKRFQIWTNLLAAAGEDTAHAETMGKVVLNGRQIKSVIRTAQIVALSERRGMTLDDLEDSATRCRSLEDDLTEVGSEQLAA